MNKNYKIISKYINQNGGDMLIERSTLFHYPNNLELSQFNKKLNVNTDGILIFFKRVPDDILKNFNISTKYIVRISIPKLKKLGSKNVKIIPEQFLYNYFNINHLTYPMIEKINNKFMEQFSYRTDLNINTYPCAKLKLSIKFLPRFTYGIMRK